METTYNYSAFKAATGKEKPRHYGIFEYRISARKTVIVDGFSSAVERYVSSPARKEGTYSAELIRTVATDSNFVSNPSKCQYFRTWEEAVTAHKVLPDGDRLNADIPTTTAPDALPNVPQGTDPTMPESAPTMPVQASNNDAATLMQAAINALIPKNAELDEAKVLSLIRREIASSPAARHEFIINGGEAKQVEGVLPDNFDDVLACAMLRQNILLVGPAGCGKTTLAAKVAEALDLRFGHVTLSDGMSTSTLLGRVLPGDNGKAEYYPSQFVDFYENGGVFLLDELDAADSNTLIAVNTALANGHMALDRHTAPIATRHADFVCVACANTFGNGASRTFVGRNQLDAATLDRFRVGTIACDYSDKVESAIVDGKVLTWGKAMRKHIKDNSIKQRFISTRVLVDMTKAITLRDWSKVLTSYFSDWSEEEMRSVPAGCRV